MTATVDRAMRHMEEISDSMLTTEQLAGVFMQCARHDLSPDTSVHQSPLSELCGVLDPHLMPTAKDFAAVYLATGKTAADRVGRWAAGTSFAPNAASESAWCRAELKRAAMRERVAA